MIKSYQLLKYDAAARTLREAAESIGKIVVTGMNGEHIKKLEEITRQVTMLGAELYALAYERYVAERNGDVKLGAE